jgi:hypothetical protein
MIYDMIINYNQKNLDTFLMQITVVGYIFRPLSGVVTRTAGTVMSSHNAIISQFKMYIFITVY